MEKYFHAKGKQLKHRKNKPWQALIYYHDENGKRKSHSKMLPRTVKGKKEADRLAEEWRIEMNKLASNAPNATNDESITSTVENYLDTQLNRGEIEKSSHKQEIMYLKRWITPYIGDECFYTLTRDSVNGWLTQLYNKGFSANSICCAFYLLRKVYNYYCDTGDIIKNPFDGVKKPKKGEARITYLTEEQMKQYLDAVYEDYEPKDREYLSFLIPFYTGLRRAEITALRWRNINLKEGIITVDSSIGEGIGGTYTKGPKSKSSIRTFPIVPQLRKAFQEVYNLTNPKPNWFVVGKGERYYHPSTLGKDFRNWADKHNLKDAYDNPIALHGLRHNFASQGVKSGMDIASLSAMLGHSSRAMTLDVYASSDKDALIVAKDKLEEQFKK